MAERKIDLIKKIISNQKAQETQDNVFEEIALSSETFDDSKIKNIYENLFYLIPKEGEESHYSIIDQSLDIVSPQTNKNLDKDIKQLESKLLDKNEEYLNKTLPELSQIHPMFPNKIFLQEGNVNNNTPVDPSSQIWFVQQGFRRAIKGSNSAFWMDLLRKSIGDKTIDEGGNPLSLSPPSLRFATPEDLMTMLEGQDIMGGTDISIKTIIAKDDQTPIFSLIELTLRCLGFERFYEFQPDEEPLYDPMGLGGYWYLDEEGHCELTMLTDEDPTYSFSPRETTKLFKAGTYIGVTISRDASLYGGEDPLSNAFYENNGRAYISSYRPEINSYVEVEKNWGEGNRIPGVINVKDGSRITYEMTKPLSSTEGGPIHSGWHYLHGLDAERDPQKDILTGYYNELSDYGTRMIYKDCYGPLKDSCYGSLGQNNNLQSLFSDPGWVYYKTHHTTDTYYEGGGQWDGGYYAGQNKTPMTGKVYGQPILSIRGGDGDHKSYVVLIGCYRPKNRNDRCIFYDLTDGGEWHMKQNQMHKTNKDHVHGYKEYSNRVFTWFRDVFRDDGYNSTLPYWLGTVNNPKLHYPGLWGESLNWIWTDLDINMYSEVWTEGGFNDELKGWMLDNHNNLQPPEPIYNFNPKDKNDDLVGSKGNNNFGLGDMSSVLDIQKTDF